MEEDEKVVKGDDVIVELEATLEDLYMGGSVKGSIGRWGRCDRDMAYEEDIKNSVPYHRDISIKGIYRSLIYSGDHDMVVPFLGTQAWIRSLNYSIIDEWRPWFVNS